MTLETQVLKLQARVVELEQVLQSVHRELKAVTMPDGFNHRVYRQVENALAGAKPKPLQFFDDHGNHRLERANGHTTPWAGYRQFTYLDGWVGHSAFFGVREDVVAPMDFLLLSAVTGFTGQVPSN